MAYPIELRRRVIEKEAEGLTQGEIAEELSVSRGWVNKISQCYSLHGELFPPRKKMGRPAKLSEADRRLLREWVDENPNLTLAQFARKMTDHLGVEVNHANIFDALKAMGYSHKKNDRAKRTAPPRCIGQAQGVAEAD